jgi:ATP synthase F1 delta subunit
VQEIAAAYARSLFEVAKEHDVLDSVRTQLGEFCDQLEASRELQVFFFSPYFSSHDKKEGVRRAIEGGEIHLVRFFELLADRHRLPVLFRIRQEFEQLWQAEQQLLSVSVTSAVALDEQTVSEIGRRIESETQKTVELTTSVDPDVIGGIILRVGNTIVDASIRSRLERLRKRVATAA